MQRLVAEALGTFVLVFAGTTAIVVNDVSAGAVSHVGVALVFGLTVSAMIYAVGDVSGAHLNPAVTLGMWVARRLPGRTVALYWASQVVGALGASALVHFLFSSHPTLGATLPAGSPAQAFTLEIVLTSILMFTILHAAKGGPESRVVTGAAVGGVVALCALLGGPISGASMNPARSLAPAVVSGQLQHLWVYLSAPLAGALVAVAACRCSRGERCCRAAAS